METGLHDPSDLKLTCWFRWKLVPVSSTYSQQSISQVQIESSLCCNFANLLQRKNIQYESEFTNLYVKCMLQDLYDCYLSDCAIGFRLLFRVKLLQNWCLGWTFFFTYTGIHHTHVSTLKSRTHNIYISETVEEMSHIFYQ